MFANGRILFSERDHWADDALEAMRMFQNREFSFWSASDLLDTTFALIGDPDLTEREFLPMQALFEVLHDALNANDEQIQETYQ